jgi:ribose 5-phosphate isomerase A
MTPSEQAQWKKTAAEAAANLVEDGMIVGLGTGSTATYFIARLGRRIAEDGLKISGVPTSEVTAVQANAAKIPLTGFAEHRRIDLTVDGADEVEIGTLNLIKGHGGALLREKIVATASVRMVVVADETKLVERLGSLVAVPVEVAQFGWQATAKTLEQVCGKTALRLGADKKPFVTDGGNYVIDCALGPMPKPEEVAEKLDHIVGVVEHGLFLGLAREVMIGCREGVKVLQRS